ncbi:hypothetical protein NMG60_11013688 [Bertholletia excelsa]
MKIFGWIQSKFNRIQGMKKPNPVSASYHVPQEPFKEEFNDWPNGLLTIGTLGNIILKENPESFNLQENQSFSEDHPQDITPEEVEELQKELTLLLHKEAHAESSSAKELDNHNLQLDNFNLMSSLANDRSNGDRICDDMADGSDQLQSNTNVIPSKGKDIRTDHKKSIGKKSFSFLLKKTFLCRNGFPPTPSLRDPIPEKSRMEKILRAILHKKIYPQSSSPKTAVAKKYLEIIHPDNAENNKEMLELDNEGSKWVKTDSEFIVLEI